MSPARRSLSARTADATSATIPRCGSARRAAAPVPTSCPMPRVSHQHTFTFAPTGTGPGVCRCGAQIESVHVPGRSRVLGPRYVLVHRGTPHHGKVVTVCGAVARVVDVATVNGHRDPGVLLLRGNDGHTYTVLARVVADLPETIRRASFASHPSEVVRS